MPALPAMAAARGALQPAKTWDRDRAAHLLRRACFGGTPADIDKLAEIGPEASVDLIVDYYLTPQTHPDFSPIDAPDRKEMRERWKKYDERERARVRQRLNQLSRMQTQDLRAWWVDRMVRSPRPFEEKMTLFWHGHFTTGAREVRTSTYLVWQNAFMRRHAVDRLRDLLIGISKDPAMLIYLDNNSNRKGHPNENYARELLELFTMGEGHYSETDIKEAARAFTGWTVGENGFAFVARQHDDGVKKFLGRTGKLNGEDVIDGILSQRATSDYMARTILEYFLTADPDKRLVNGLAAEMRRNNYDMRATMKTLFASEAFYDETLRFNQIKSPVELVVGTARLLETPIDDFDGVLSELRTMGQELYQPPNVKGWDGGRKWINTATLFSRYNFASDFVRGSNRRQELQAEGRRRRRDAVIEEVVANIDDYPGLSIPTRPVDPAGQPAFDPVLIVERNGLESREAVVDHFVQRLLQQPIDADRRAALLEMLDDEREDFDAKRLRKRIIGMVNVILNMPEYQLK